MRQFSAAHFQALFAVISLAVAGCGGSPGRPASAHAIGRVTYQGQPVVEGTVNLISSTGDAGSAPLTPEGTFEIREGIPPGTYLAFVTPPRITHPPKPGEPPPEMRNYGIPAVFQSEVTTPLKVEIKPGDNPGVELKLE